MRYRTTSLRTRLLLSGMVISGTFFLPFKSATAACNFTPTLGDDIFTCDSGTSVGGLSDPNGNNTLRFPERGDGTIPGNVSFGNGADKIEMHSGRINGAVDQGGGADSFVISGGTVTGNVQQGNGIDDFQMTGGVIGSLSQGDSLDTFFMSGGRIVDFFEDGDSAVMTGGRIGRVNMKLDNNFFKMSGGTIDGNLVTGFGNDTIILSNGSIGGNISVSGGTDSVTVTGGKVGGNVLMSVGADTFKWNGGGVIQGVVDLGGDNDVATLSNLTQANIGATPQVTGGTGVDALTFSNVTTAGVARFDSWESIALTNHSQLTFDGALTLGDAGTSTGALTVDSSSTIFGGDAHGVVTAFAPGQPVQVTNAGRIDLTNGGGGVTDTFTIRGNYVGQGGELRLNAALGGDASPSDKLVIDGGAATGATGIGVVNAGGIGGQTLVDGIMVVQGINGGTTAANAFSLSGPVAAGAYEYLLFKGGVTAGTSNNWYLRSNLVAGPTPAPGTPPLPAAVAGAAPLPFYRPEVALYAAVPSVARQMGLATLGTFHERQGDQSLLVGGDGTASAAWGRVFGQNIEQRRDGTVSPDFDGNIAGMQTGIDLFAKETASGHRDRLGLFLGYAHASGDVHGVALGQPDAAVGDITLNSYSLGGYWTHIGPGGWYVDTVVMNTWIAGDPHSYQGVSADTDGNVVTASLEGGYPIALGRGLTFEPQSQVIWQHTSMSDTQDRFSTVAFNDTDTFTGRIGARLQGDVHTANGLLQPYLKTNLWYGSGLTDNVTFAGTDVIPTIDSATTSVEVGGGVAARVTQSVSLYGSAGYTTEVDGDHNRIIKGNLGLRVTW